MPLVKFPKSAILGDTIVEPAWYRVHIDEVGEWVPTKDKASNNMEMDGTILFNADTRDKKFEGVPIGGVGQWSFNDKPKAMRLALGLLKALAQQIGIDADKIDENMEFEYKALEGKQVDMFIGNDTYQGRIKNKATHQYRAPRDLA